MCGRLRVGKSFFHACSSDRSSHVFGRYGNAYGVARSANVVYIQVTLFNTRTVEQ
jgi:hypothetical protein